MNIEEFLDAIRNTLELYTENEGKKYFEEMNINKILTILQTAITNNKILKLQKWSIDHPDEWSKLISNVNEELDIEEFRRIDTMLSEHDFRELKYLWLWKNRTVVESIINFKSV